MGIEMKKSSVFGISSAIIGMALLLATFFLAYALLQGYGGAVPARDLGTSMSVLLYAAIQALFLGIMGWVGSLLLLRGVDFLKVDRGVGVVTFKVEKGVGVITGQEEEEKKQNRGP
jgi:hypothetical protein